MPEEPNIYRCDCCGLEQNDGEDYQDECPQCETPGQFYLVD